MKDYSDKNATKMIYVIQSIYFTADIAFAFFDKSKPPAMIAIIYILLMLCVWYSSIVDRFVQRKWPFRLFVFVIYGIGLYASVQLWQTKTIGTMTYFPLLLSIGVSQMIILIKMYKDV